MPECPLPFRSSPAVTLIDPWQRRLYIVYEHGDEHQPPHLHAVPTEILSVDLDLMTAVWRGEFGFVERITQRADHVARDNRPGVSDSTVVSFAANAPEAYIDEVEVEPREDGSEARIHVRLMTRDSRPVRVRVRYAAVAEGRPSTGFRDAVIAGATSGLATSPEGTEHTLVHRLDAEFEGVVQYEVLAYDTLETVKDSCHQPPNDYRVTTYQSTYDCILGIWSTPVEVANVCVDWLPSDINTWMMASSCTAQGSFSHAFGTGDFDCTDVGVVPALPIALPRPSECCGDPEVMDVQALPLYGLPGCADGDEA